MLNQDQEILFYLPITKKFLEEYDSLFLTGNELSKHLMYFLDTII